MAEEVRYSLKLDGVDNFDKSLSGLNNSANILESSIGKIGAAAIAAFSVYKIYDFTKSIVEAGSKIENARTGLTTLLKDQEEASKVIKDTMADAMATPFEFEGLLLANKALISAGVNSQEARKDVLSLANAVAATGGSNDELTRMVVNMQQIKNAGQATAMDIRQFAYAGINMHKLLADSMGLPIEKVRDMRITYDMLTSALEKAHDKGGMYENGLENMAKNTSVQLSNIGDAFFQLKVKMFDDMKPMFDAVINVIQNTVKGFSELWNWIIENKGKLTGIFEPIINLGRSIWQFFEPIKDIFNFLKPIFFEIVGIAYQLGASMMNALSGIIDVAHTIYVALEKLYIIDAIKLILTGVWETLKLVGNGIIFLYDHTLKPIFDAIGWVYGQIKDLLGIKDYKVNVGITGLPEKQKENAIEGSKGSASAGKSGALTPSNESSKVTGTKQVTINVSINKLVEMIKIEARNIKEGANSASEDVAKALLGAVNQFSASADI